MKRFTLKRITALALALIMTLSLCPVSAFAMEGDPLADGEQVYVVEEPTEPIADASEPVAEDEPVAPAEDDTENAADGTTEYALETVTVTAPLANSAATTAQAQWGLATGENSDQAPASWTSGTLDEAMTYANDLESGTAYIQLLSDVDTTAPLEFASGKTTILDLNGCDIDRGLTAATENGNVITVNGDLTLYDTSANAATTPGKITGGYNDGNGGGVVSSGMFTMNGGAISGNTATGRGGGVDGRLTMTGGFITGNTSTDVGGGACVSNSTMTGGTISKNSAVDMGGGVMVLSGTFTMDGGLITDNTVNYLGGGVYSQTSFVMKGGTISQNRATGGPDGGGSGGGVNVTWGSFTMTDGFITGNVADIGGGMTISPLDNGGFILSGGTISGNTAKEAGGGIYSRSSGLQIFGTPVISGNVLNGTLNSTNGLYELGTNGVVSNVCLSNKETITVVGALTADAVIGVTLNNVPTNAAPASVAVGGGEDSTYTLTASDAAKFVGDDGSFGAVNSTNNIVQMKLAKANLSGAGVVAPGSEVALLLNVSGTGITGAKGTLEYDSNMLECVSCKNVATGWTMSQDGANYTLTGTGSPITAETGALLVTFRVKNTVPVGTQLNVSFKNTTLTDGSNDFNIGDVSWTGTVDSVSATATLTGSSVVSAGSKVTLTLNISGNDAKRVETTLDYDNGLLEYVSHKSSLPEDWEMTQEGTKFVFSSEDRSINSTAELLTVTLAVKRNAPAGAVLSASFTDITLSDGSSTNTIGTAFWRGAVNDATEARWGLAIGDNCDQAPTTWVSSGTLVDAVYYANELTDGVAYIQLLSDVDTTAMLVFNRDKSTILDLNGYDIDRGLTKPTYDGSVIYVWGDFTLCDTSANAATAPGKITGGYSDAYYGDDASGGGVYVRGSFTMNGGEISGNTAGRWGGGVYTYYGVPFTMNGGIISNNYAYGGGGAYTWGPFVMNDGVISENTAETAGGGVECYEFTMRGGSISRNTAKQGGGVFASSDTFKMTGGTISGNTATQWGGGVLCYYSFKMSGGSITGNSVNVSNMYNGLDYGAGVYLHYVPMEVWGSPFISGNVVNGTFNEKTGLYEMGANGFENNVALDDNAISVVGKLNDDAAIGVYHFFSSNETSCTVATGYDANPSYTLTEEDAAKFTSDEGFRLEYDNVNKTLQLLKIVSQVKNPRLDITSGKLNLFDDSTLVVPVNWEYVGVSAEFVDTRTQNTFDITVSNNGCLEISLKTEKPEDMSWVEWGKTVTGTYKSAIRIKYSGKYYTSENMLSITLTATAPKVTASAVKFNSFRAGDTQELVLTTSETVASVALDESLDNPDWITVNEDGTVTLINEKLVNNKVSGKLNLEVWLEGWRVPAQVAVSVSVAYTAPKLKLNASSVNLMSNSQYQEPIAMQLLSGDKTAFDQIGVTNLRVADVAEMSTKDQKTYAASAYVKVVEDSYQVTGEFMLMTEGTPINGKVLLLATIDGAATEIAIPLTVKVVMPALKANPAKVTLNTAKGYDEGARDEMTVTFSGDVPAFWYSDVSWEITPPKNASADMLAVENNNDGTVTFYANEGIVDGSYKVNVTVGAAKPVAITVTAKATLPKLKLSKSSITLNTAMGDYADVQTVDVTDSDANYDFVLLQDEITAPDGLSAVVNENNTLSVSAAATTAPGSYKVEIDHKMPGGQSVKSTLTVKVVEKLPTLKPDNKALSLDTTHGIATVNVDGLAGFTVGELVAEPTVDGITVDMIDDDSFTVKINETLDKKGGKINVSFKLSETVATKPVAITVKPVTAITTTASVKGNMDVTRPDTTSSNFTFRYTGWYPGAYGEDGPTLVWEVYAMNGKNQIAKYEAYDFVTGKGHLVASSDDNNGGWFCDVDDADYGVSLALNTDEVGAWKNGEVNPKYTYNVYFALDFGDGDPIELSKPVKMTVKQGSVKFAANVKAVDLYKTDIDSSAAFAINSTDKDADNVADVACVAVAASKTDSPFAVVESGDGYAIEIIDPTIAKSGTVKLNIWLEGNYEEGCESVWDTKSPEYRKPNATISLKVNVK